MSAAKFLFVVLMLICIVTDLSTYRVRNSVIVALVVLFVVQGLLEFKQVNWTMHLGAAAVILALGYLLFLRGDLGGGDVKLFSTAALWAGIPHLFPLLLYVSLSGLAVMLVLVVTRRLFAWRPSLWQTATSYPVPQVLMPGGGIPYGVGVAVGSLITMPLFPAWLWQ